MASVLKDGPRIELRPHRSGSSAGITAYLDGCYLGEVSAIEPGQLRGGPGQVTIVTPLAYCRFAEQSAPQIEES